VSVLDPYFYVEAWPRVCPAPRSDDPSCLTAG
jgi:hypothetical protein